MKVVTQMGNQGHSMDGTRSIYENTAGAPSARCRRSTSGPTPHSATGRRVFPARHRLVRARARRYCCAFPRGGSTLADGRCAVIAIAAPPIPCDTSHGICSWAGRQMSSTTRSITRTTGVGGWTGARVRLGIWGAHLIDHPFRALDLGMPAVIETVSTPFNGVWLSRMRRRPTISSRRAAACRRSG